MAGGTVIGKMRHRFFQHVGAQWNGILRVSLLDRDGQVTSLARHEHLDRRGFRLRTKTSTEQSVAEPYSDCAKCSQAYENEHA